MRKILKAAFAAAAIFVCIAPRPAPATNSDLFQIEKRERCTDTPCIVVFPLIQPPSGSTMVIITKVSCNFYFKPIVSELTTVSLVTVNGNGDVVKLGQFLTPITLMDFGSTGAFSQYQFLSKAFQPFMRGERPGVAIAFDPGGVGTVSTVARCTLNGYYG